MQREREDFVERTVSEEEGPCKVSLTRSSNVVTKVTIHYRNANHTVWRRVIDLSRVEARILAGLLNDISDETCSLDVEASTR